MKRTVFFITRSALVAAIYFALATALQPISFGPVQFRLSEALVLLPVFMPESIIGVTLGCFLSNFFYSTMYDVIFGTIATAVAAVLTYLLRRTKFLYVLPPLLLNALLVPLIWVVDGSDAAYLLNFALILASEVIVVCLIGLPVTLALRKALTRAGIQFYTFRKALAAPAYFRDVTRGERDDETLFRPRTEQNAPKGEDNDRA